MPTPMQVIDQALGRKRGAASDLARTLNISRNTVSRWRRAGPVPPNRWLDIEDALDIERFTIAEATGMTAHLPDLKSMSEAEAEETWRALFPPDDAGPRSHRALQIALLRGLDRIDDELEAVGWTDPDPLDLDPPKPTTEQARLLKQREAQEKKMAEAALPPSALEGHIRVLFSELNSLRADVKLRLDELAAEGRLQEQRRQETLHLVLALAELLGVDRTSLPHVD